MEKENVYKSYNKIASWFAQNRGGLIEKYYLDKIIEEFGPDGSVLDVGCGAGKPILDYLLSKRLTVLGVDASSTMLEIAKANFPDVEFLLQDMRLLKLDREFDALIAWHSFFHLPATDQRGMFRIFADHLKPGGLLLFTSGKEGGESWGMNGGENLFHASLDTKEYDEILKNNGFWVVLHTLDDPDCGGATVWLARLDC